MLMVERGERTPRPMVVITADVTLIGEKRTYVIPLPMRDPLEEVERSDRTDLGESSESLVSVSVVDVGDETLAFWSFSA